MLDKAIITGFLIVVVCSAMALGTVEAWSLALLELATISLVLLWLIKAWVERRLEVKFSALAWPFALLLCVGALQSVALDAASGERWSLSRDVEATRAAVIVAFFLFVLFVVALNFFATRERLRLLGAFLTLYGFILALFAIIQRFTWEGKMFWFRELKAATGYGGPFVNRNHFAGYMEMLVPIALSLALMPTKDNHARYLYGFATVIMGVSVVASLSRGGMLSLAAGLVFIAITSAIGKSRERSTGGSAALLRPLALVALVAVSILAGIFWVGADLSVAERLAQQGSENPAGRYGIWGDTLRMIASNPTTGVGLGAYQTAFTAFSSGDGSLIIEYAHNDYLQVLADTGIIGGALAVWFLVILGRSFVNAIRTEDSRMRATALGCGGGIFALLVHSLFDFNLQIPSNALLFLLLSAAVTNIGAMAPQNLRSSRGVTPRHDRSAMPSRNAA